MISWRSSVVVPSLGFAPRPSVIHAPTPSAWLRYTSRARRRTYRIRRWYEMSFQRVVFRGWCFVDWKRKLWPMDCREYCSRSCGNILRRCCFPRSSISRSRRCSGRKTKEQQGHFKMDRWRPVCVLKGRGVKSEMRKGTVQPCIRMHHFVCGWNPVMFEDYV